MKEDPNVKHERSVLVPFLVGGLVGAGIAILAAPKSGKELRKDIKDIASETSGRISATFEKGRDIYEGSASAVKNAFEAGKTAYVEEREKHRKAA